MHRPVRRDVCPSQRPSITYSGVGSERWTSITLPDARNLPCETGGPK